MPAIDAAGVVADRVAEGVAAVAPSGTPVR
jgi:hypothetical protein